jgi:hypothetical protein
MDELDLLRGVLTKPEPSEDMVSRHRLELQRLIRHQSRARAGRRRRRWVAGIGLTAAVAAGAVTAVLVMAPDTAHPRSGASRRSTAMRHHPVAKNQAKQTVQQILLTAAASAQRAPAGSGTYWYVRVRWASSGTNKLYLSESWTRRDGQTWIRNQKTGERPFKLPRSPLNLGPFLLGGRGLTFGQLRKLPTNPGALTKWIVNNASRHGGKTGGPSPSNARTRQDIFDSLTSLLSELPAAPRVRATAFRSLASLPGVTSLGPVGGGQGVRFTLLGGERATLIIDSSTGQIRATNFFVDNQGAEYWQQIPNATITGRWTDTLP